MDPYLISVVVPIYNAEKYLDRCVSSIANQTYKNLEIILVDDGSVDHSAQKCDEWSEKDHRIRVIHQNNSGTMAARMAGIRLAKGDYIGFVDSDDWIDKEMYAYLLSILQKHSGKIVSCNFREVISEILQESNNDLPEVIKHYVFEDIIENMIPDSLCFLWKNLYHCSLFDHLPVLPSNLKCSEDMLLNYFLYKNAGEMFVSNQIKYNYFRHSESVLSGCINYNLIDDSFKAYEIINQDFDKNVPFYPYFLTSKVLNDFFLLNSIVRNQTCLDRYAMLREDILKYKQYIFNKKYKDAFEPRHRIGTFLLAVAPKVYNSTILIRRKIRGY